MTSGFPNKNEARFTVVLPEDLHQKLVELIPIGLRKHLMTALLQAALDGAEEHGGHKLVGALMMGRFKIVPLFEGEEEDAS